MRFTSPPLSYIPLLPILIGVVIGILLCRYVQIDAIILVGGSLGIAALAVKLKRGVLVEIFLAISLGAFATSMVVPRRFTQVPTDVEMHGYVTEVAKQAENQQIYVDVEPKSGRDFTVLLTYPAFDIIVEPGDVVSFSGSYNLPCREVDLPLEDDMSEYYYNKGISLRCYVPKGDLDVVGHSDNIMTILKRWRRQVVDEIFTSGLNENTAVFVAAILTGDTTALTSERRKEYAVAGVAHILALSGAHVAVIVVIVSIMLFPLAVVGQRRLRWWLTIAVLWGYALFTGMSPSVCRSVIMATAVLLAFIYDRPRSSFNSLCLAAILILIFSPLSLMNVGFQLSFAATLAIVLFSPLLLPVFDRNMRFYTLWAGLTTTVAATLGTFPFVAYHFHSVPVYFLVANIAIIFVSPIMIAGGMLYVVLSLFGFDPTWLEWVLNGVYSVFDYLVVGVSQLPHASLNDIYIEWWLLIPMFLTLAFLLALFYQRRKVYAVLAVVTLIFTVGVYKMTCPVYKEGEGYVVRAHSATTIAQHNGDTLRMLTTSPRHNYTYDSLAWSNRYRDYIATRGITRLEIQPLDSTSLTKGAVAKLGRRKVRIAHALNYFDEAELEKADYCLVTSRWYGDPVALYDIVNVDTIVLSLDINKRRRLRYGKELKEAGVPVIDLGERQLSAN